MKLVKIIKLVDETNKNYIIVDINNKYYITSENLYD